MTLQDCYMAMGGNYTDVVTRLRSDRLVRKFVLKFPDDGSFDLLRRSLEEKRYEEAFRAAHTIKGMCQNLSFDRLLVSSSRLTEALRSGWTAEVDGLFQEVSADYRDTVSAILKFRAESEGV